METYFATKSYQSVQIQFRKRIHCCNFPPKSTIVILVTDFREHGTVLDLCSKATGGNLFRQEKEKNIAAVRDSVGHSPRKTGAVYSLIIAMFSSVLALFFLPE